MDSVFYPFFYHSHCEYFLALGDLVQARREATRLYEVAKLPPERSYLALSYRLLAKIAFAGGSLDEAKFQLSRAISIVDKGELPLAAWRVYATAAEFHASFGETVKSAEFRHRGERIIEFLAENFDRDDPLRSSLLAAQAGPAKLGTGFAIEHATNQGSRAR